MVSDSGSSVSGIAAPLRYSYSFSRNENALFGSIEGRLLNNQIELYFRPEVRCLLVISVAALPYSDQ